MERIEIEGEWWLPENKERRLFGTLVIDDDALELSLVGALGQSDGLSSGLLMSGQSRSFPRIHGQSNSKPFTLDRCFQTRRTGLGGGLATQRLSVHQAFQGIRFDLDEAIEFTQIAVRLAGLNEFVQRSGLSGWQGLTEEAGGSRASGVSFSALHLAAESFPGLDGAECSLGHVIQPASTDFREIRITEEWVLRTMHPNLQSSEALLKAASYLRDLVSIATGRRAAFTSVSFWHPEVGLALPDEDRKSIPIEMYANWVVKAEPNKAPVKEHEVLFSLDDLGGVDALARWLVVAQRNGSFLSRAMVSRYSDTPYITDNVINAVAALEGYDRDKHNDKKTLIDRLKRSAATAGPQFTDLVGDIDEFARLLKVARHDVAHHNTGLEGTTAHIFLSRAAVWLLILCLLRDANAPEVVFDKIADHANWRWLKGHVHEAVTPTSGASGP